MKNKPQTCPVPNGTGERKEIHNLQITKQTIYKLQKKQNINHREKENKE
jgi:hypothetical protein